MFRVLALCIILICVTTVNSVAQPPLKMGYFDFPPFYSRTEAGEPKGLLIDIARDRFAKINRDVEFVYGTAADLVNGVARGDLDVAMLIPYPPIADKILYTDFPVSTMELMAFRGVQTPSISSIKDLAAQDVLTLKGFAYGGRLRDIKALDPQPRLIEASDIHSGIDLLLSGRAAYFLSYLKPAQEIAESKGFLLEDQWLLADQIDTFDIFITLSRETAGASKIVKALNETQGR